MKIKRMIGVGALMLALWLFTEPARASQGSCVMPTSGTVSGLTLVQDINTCIDAVLTNASGASAPVNGAGGVSATYQWWLKTGDKSLNLYDSASWVPLGYIDSTGHIWQPPIGGGTVPSVASATTTDLWSVKPAAVSVTGTTTITALASASAVPGTLKVVRFTGALTLTHNATSLILPGGANITTAAGDAMWVEALTTTNVAVISYVKASGLPVVPLATIAAHTFLGNITGSTAVPAASSLSAILDAELGSTRGQIVYRGASLWSVLATGTAGQVLQTGGAAANPSWATVSAPVLLATLTANNTSGTLADTTNLTSTYPRYSIIFTSLIPATNAIACRLRVNVAGVQTTGYDSQLNGTQNGTNDPQQQTTYIACSRLNALSNTGMGVNAEFFIYNPSQTSSPKAIHGTGIAKDDASATSGIFVSGGAYTAGNGAVTGIEVTTTSGNWTSGTVKIYGLP